VRADRVVFFELTKRCGGKSCYSINAGQAAELQSTLSMTGMAKRVVGTDAGYLASVLCLLGDAA
jgi:hypothetical protein